MGKKHVNLTLGAGSFEQGFEISLKILDATGEHQKTGFLPAAPEIPQIFSKWKICYKQSKANQATRLEAKSAIVTNVSIEDNAACLSEHLNDWLNSKNKDWQKIRDYLQDVLGTTDEIVLTIESKNDLVSRLPWHLWSWFFDRYKQAEIFFNLPEYKPPHKLATRITGRIKVLAIVGDSKGINTQEDLKLLKKLPNIQLKFLIEPQQQELEDPLWNEGWDILFFAGHSRQSKSGAGVFGINQNESLTINDLRYALQRAVARGLKLAILNSCDGIGLAKDLAELGIPQILVMREQVPDRVAQAFLKNFLTAFAKENKPFYLAYREAREKLKGLENVYPYASWLPAVFQNPAIGKFSWHTLSGIRQEKGLLGNFKRKLIATLLVSTAATATAMGMRSAGWLQSFELQAFDRLLLLRPDEKPDPRLLIVTVTEKDLKLPEQKDARGSLSDLALEKLIQKLERYDPRLIVLDIYRDFPVTTQRQELASYLRQSNRFIAVCKASDPEFDPDGVAPPPEIPQERLGFSDSITDPDGIVRRHLLAGTPPAASPCATPYALSLLSAAHYLARQGILLEYTPEGFIKLGNVIFSPLETRPGSYQNVDTSANQIVLNYRRVNGSLEKVAEKMTLSQVLRGPLNPVFVKDKIILIGTTANSFQDDWSTPYSYRSNFQDLSGVMLQAQGISQILSAVLDRRSLLYSWPVWADVLWIFSWSVLGGILTVKLRSPLSLVLGLVAAQSALVGISFVLLYCGCWTALVPSTIGLVVCSGGLILIKQFDKDGQKSNFLQNSISS